MKKNKYKKVPISEFISDKKLSKIKKIIDTSECVEVAYDRIETLLCDNYKVLGLGTNRLILVCKKDKYKDLVFKVAGDSHGIEANYREFYNGDLDKSLTFSYSISDDGLFVVQERVKVLDSKSMDKYKKDVRKMLKHLSNKLLLVDCKMSNFRNFGIGKNGDIVLLDHGDTVPLPKSQTSNIVNIDEESNVSLRCKKFKDASDKTSKLKPCGGKLEYSKNFEYLKCSRCGAIMSVNDAYKEFYGDKNARIDVHSDFIDGLNFDPDEWSKQIKAYAKDTMSSVNKNNINNEGECKMKEKMINGKKCTQMKGYWVPDEIFTNPMYAMLVNSVRLNKTKPKDFITQLGLDPNEYAVRIEDHTPNKNRAEWKERIGVAVNEVLAIMKEHNENKYAITYKEIEERCGFVIDGIEKEKEIFKRVIGGCNIDKFIYKRDRFVVIVSEEVELDEATMKPSISVETNDVNMNIDNSVTNDVDVNALLGIQTDITQDDIDDSEVKLVISSDFKAGDFTINEECINDYDLSVIADEIEDDVLANKPVNFGRYDTVIVSIDEIEKVFQKFNKLYDNIFNELFEIEDMYIRLNLYRELLDRYMEFSRFQSVASNCMNGFNLEFMIPGAPDPDEEYYDEDDDFENEEDDDTDDNEDLNPNQQFNDNENEEDEDLNELKNLVNSLNERIDTLSQTVKCLENRICELENSEGSVSEESSEDSDDGDGSEPNNGNVSTRSGAVNECPDGNGGYLVTIDVNKLPEGADILIDKGGILYRLDPSILSASEEGLYDMIRISLKKFGNSTNN